ncbi:MAG: phosphoenolpyruvate hydrolase family protein [Pseudomonadota bacterium]
MAWKIHERSDERSLPPVILTAKSAAVPSTLSPEISALLPTQKDDGSWLSDMPRIHPQGACAGLFMADPLHQQKRMLNLLRDAGVGWLINLPSVSQHDAEFETNLGEVGLGPRKELEVLRSYQKEGFDCIAAVSSARDAEFALSLDLKNIAVLPRVQAYESGFPSELHRNRQVAEVWERIKTENAALLSLVTAAEAAAQSVWPPQVHAVIERPSASG